MTKTDQELKMIAEEAIIELHNRGYDANVLGPRGMPRRTPKLRVEKTVKL